MPKFQYFEVVVVNSTASNAARFYQMQGVMLGLTEEDDSTWGYSVYFDDFGETFYFHSDDLTSTGKFHHDFYSGKKIKVEVDPNTGAGRLADENQRL
ncbi:MAG: Imm31 family immunity protein [bacterium]|nr:Imm31 family immunity protein [bacterium]